MRVGFLTLGCKVNSYETEKMKIKFEEQGHTVVAFEEKADVYIVNTCTVTLQTVNPERCCIVLREEIRIHW